jgi:DNA-binding MarR family transcriptional regulator
MTDAPILSGVDLVRTDRAPRALVDALLAQTQMTFNAWVALNVTGTSGGEMTKQAIIERMVSVLKVEPQTAASAIAENAEAGLVSINDDHVSLTPAETQRFEQLREGALAIAERLYGGLPAEDLIATRRVLAAAAERADAAIAAGTRPAAEAARS